MTYVTVPSAAARTGVSGGTIKSTAFLRLPICAGDDLSILQQVLRHGHSVFVLGAHQNMLFLRFGLINYKRKTNS